MYFSAAFLKHRLALAAPDAPQAAGSDIRFTPWLEDSVGDDDDRGHGDHAFNSTPPMAGVLPSCSW